MPRDRRGVGRFGVSNFCGILHSNWDFVTTLTKRNLGRKSVISAYDSLGVGDDVIVDAYHENVCPGRSAADAMHPPFPENGFVAMMHMRRMKQAAPTRPGKMHMRQMKQAALTRRAMMHARRVE